MTVELRARPRSAPTLARPLTHPSGISRKGAVVDATDSSEEWRPVVDWEGLYEVSDQGRVRSLDRIINFPDGRSRRANGRVIKPWTISRGRHDCVQLKDGRRQRKVLVHVLVLETFRGPRPEGMEGCHGPGGSLDNRAVNLRWDTHGGNCLDMVTDGTHNHARKTHCKHGHEFTPENTRRYTRPNGRTARVCRKCHTSGRERVLATHCGAGHEFTPDNTYIPPSGRYRTRQCRQCRNRRARARRLERALC